MSYLTRLTNYVPIILDFQAALLIPDPSDHFINHMIVCITVNHVLKIDYLSKWHRLVQLLQLDASESTYHSHSHFHFTTFPPATPIHATRQPLVGSTHGITVLAADAIN